MKKFSLACLIISQLLLFFESAWGQSMDESVKPLIENSCLYCHDSSTETGLDFESLGYDLNDAKNFSVWQKIHDRVQSGEMPPATEPRPDAAELDSAMATIYRQLLVTNQKQQSMTGRVPARRLTKRELQFTLEDLFLIEGNLTDNIPDEVEAGSFDTVGSNQRISAVHMENYLRTADRALDLAIQMGRNPSWKKRLDYINSPFLNAFHDKEISLGGNVSRRLEDGVALFRDVDYLITSAIGGFNVRTPGIYRITTEVAAYQSRKPVPLKIIRKEPGGGASLIANRELNPDETETVVTTTFLNPGDTFYTTFQMEQEPFAGLIASGGAKNYKGPGIAIKTQSIEGPLSETWPPPSTQKIFAGLTLKSVNGSPKGPFKISSSNSTMEDVETSIRKLAPKIFRRPVSDDEISAFLKIAQPAAEQGRSLEEVLRLTLRSMLSSPQFLLFDAKPGQLDEYALANRLSYFFWKSMPDKELFRLAEQGKLSSPQELSRQVDRMLADEKSKRFIRDFLGQWMLLYKLNATTPDEKLYPEYDELLGDALPKETELFFTELVEQNLAVTHLIDSNFTFVNRRLAEHYKIADIEGAQFRRVTIPENNPRGGILTQAAILKTTANGTTTSPVMRGNFVLTNFLGTPPSPPPPSIGSIEPDTRGKTTIREILAAHRDMETCARCHREIDPPGFAMESFDPIGGFRKRYRASTENGGALENLFGGGRTFKSGPKVDASGVTSAGKQFDGIEEFKKLLLDEKEQVATNLISQLVVYSTGSEIQFADRETIDAILDRTRRNDFPIRDLIHEVVQSKLFLHQ